VEPIDSGAKRWDDEGPGAGENGRLSDAVEDGSHACGRAQLVHVVARHVV